MLIDFLQFIVRKGENFRFTIAGRLELETFFETWVCPLHVEIRKARAIQQGWQASYQEGLFPQMVLV
jgi:hypothetical protein